MNDIGPQRFDLIGIKHIVPWRHITFTVGHRINKPSVSIARKVSQIDPPLRVAHTRAVARRAMAREQRCTSFDLLWRKLRLIAGRRGARAHERETQAYSRKNVHMLVANCLPYSGINAKVHTEPPVGTRSATFMVRLRTPPMPDRTATYCRP